jgi:hypothetical protein
MDKHPRFHLHFTNTGRTIAGIELGSGGMRRAPLSDRAAHKRERLALAEAQR